MCTLYSVHSIDFVSLLYAFRTISKGIDCFERACLFHIYHASNYQSWTEPQFKQNPNDWFNKSNFTHTLTQKQTFNNALYRDRSVKRLLAAYRISWDHPWARTSSPLPQWDNLFLLNFILHKLPAYSVLSNCLVKQKQQKMRKQIADSYINGWD